MPNVTNISNRLTIQIRKYSLPEPVKVTGHRVGWSLTAPMVLGTAGRAASSPAAVASGVARGVASDVASDGEPIGACVDAGAGVAAFGGTGNFAAGVGAGCVKPAIPITGGGSRFARSNDESSLTTADPFC